MVFHTTHPMIGQTALELSRELILTVCRQETFNIDKAISRLENVVDQYALGTNTALIAKAATKHKVPFIRPTPHNWLQLGYGKYSTYYSPGLLEESNCISIEMCQDKQFTKECLDRFNIPLSSSFM